MGEEKEKKRRERRREREKGEERRKRVWGDGMTTTIGVTFNSGDRGNLKGEEREERLEIGDDEILTIQRRRRISDMRS